MPDSRTLLALLLVLQAACCPVCSFTPMFTWLSGQVGLLQPHLTGSALAITCVSNPHVLLCIEWEQRRQIASRSLHAIYSSKQMASISHFFQRSGCWVSAGIFGNWPPLEVCFQLLHSAQKPSCREGGWGQHYLCTAPNTDSYRHTQECVCVHIHKMHENQASIKCPSWTHSLHLIQPGQSLESLAQNERFHVFILLRGLV